MGEVLKERGASLTAVVAPLFILLFSWVPWEADSRHEPMEQRVYRLQKGRFWWEKLDYQRLLKTVDPNTRIGRKPLFVVAAIETPDAALLRSMLLRGAKVNLSDWGCTPLYAALTAVWVEGNTRSKKELSDDGWESIPTVTMLLRHGADPNLLPDPSVRKSLGSAPPCGEHRTPLDDAIDAPGQPVFTEVQGIGGDPHVLEKMVTYGFRPRTAEEGRKVWSEIAWHYGHGSYPALIDVLKEYAEGSDSVLPYGHTLLGEEVSSGNVESVIQLITKGANPNKRSKRGMLPLQLAIEHCPYTTQALDVLDALLSNGADPNLPLKEGFPDTLLAFAVQRCRSDVPKLLVKHKARIDDTAIDLAGEDLKKWFQAERGKPAQ